MNQEIYTEYAPEGYRAELATLSAFDKRALCTGCAFDSDPSPCDDRPCTPYDRPDGTHVIFVKL